MSNQHKIQDLLRDWIDIAKRYEKGMIPANSFLQIHSTIAGQASHIKPTMLEEARLQLRLFALMRKEETIAAFLQHDKAMDDILGNVVDFLQEKN